jgi:cytochrome c peroxidase
MKRLLLFVLILGCLTSAIGAINLIVHRPKSGALAELADANPDFARVAAILQTSCADCHTPDTTMPFYSKIPGARQAVEWDVNTGRSFFNLAAGAGSNNRAPSEVALARIEWSVQNGSMPPLRYTAMHWNAHIGSNALTAIDTWIKAERAKHFALGETAEKYRYSALQPIPSHIEIDRDKANLGEKLYHDTRLSADNSIACSSCHGLDLGGTDRAKTSKGINNQLGPVNAPTVFNAGFQFAQFWDGRATTLEEQAGGPILNPIEMGATWEIVLEKLSRDQEFAATFTKTYPEGLSPETITSALAEFERTLYTPNSRFDRYLKGDATALSEQEQEGLALFSEFGCATCHVGKALGGQSFEKMGRHKDYFAARSAIRDEDYGRYNVTKQEVDRFNFKVPMLRNIAITGPYYHDGSITDLGQAVDLMIHHQSDYKPRTGQTEKIVAFLETLTGELNGKPLQ